MSSGFHYICSLYYVVTTTTRVFNDLLLCMPWSLTHAVCCRINKLSMNIIAGYFCPRYNKMYHLFNELHAMTCPPITFKGQFIQRSTHVKLNKSVFSYLRTLTTRHCSHSPAAAAIIDRYLLPAGPTAANLQQRVCCCGPMLGQTDGWTPYRFISK